MGEWDQMKKKYMIEQHHQTLPCSLAINNHIWLFSYEFMSNSKSKSEQQIKENSRQDFVCRQSFSSISLKEIYMLDAGADGHKT